MSILDNEGHDPNGLGNRPRCDVDHQSIAAHFERELIEAQAEIERLRALPEAIAIMLESFTPDQIRLAAGEMSAQEMRAVTAVQKWWAAAVRHTVSQQAAKPGI